METQQGDVMSTMKSYLDAIAQQADFTAPLTEKTLTPAELKKREEIAQAIERDNPDMPMDKKMAIATSKAKDVAEDLDEISSKEKMKRGLYNKEETEDQKKAKSDLDLKLSKWRNQQRAEKAMKEETVAEARGHSILASKMKSMDSWNKQPEAQKKDDVPFDPDPPKKNPSATAGKYGLGHSVSRHLARQGIKTVAKEEVEQIAELDKKTLGSYVKKAGDDYTKREVRIDRALSKDITTDTKQAEKKQSNRKIGISKAVDRLTKEEVELDEISKATLGSYIKKASEQGKKAAVSAGISNKALGSAMASGNKHLTRAHDDNIISSQNLENKRKAGISKAVDKLTKEDMDLTEAEMSHAQILKKIKDGTHEAMTDIKPGKHVELRHTGTGVKKMVLVKHEAVKEEVEQIDELSKDTLNRYVDRASLDHAHQNMGRRNTEGGSQKEFARKEALRKKGISRAVDKLNKEEVEQIDEVSGAIVDRALNKAGSNLTKAMKSKDYAAGVKSQKQIHKFLNYGEKKGTIRNLEKHSANESVEQIDELTAAQRDELRTNVARSTKPRDDTFKRKVKQLYKMKDTEADTLARLKKERGVKEEVEELDEISQDTVKQYAKKAMTDIKASMAMRDTSSSQKAKDVANVNIAKRAKGLAQADKRLGEEHTEELEEAMISYSDFKDKLNMHRKAGNKVVDDKYSKDKASFTTIDKDGMGRKVTHTSTGTKHENLGKVGKVEDDEADEVSQTEKRGRGRPAGSKSGARRHN